jgi:hypothetical protein
MGPFLPAEDYCAPGSSVEGDTFVFGSNSCINPACWCHDACGRGQCTRDECQYTSTSGSCDADFFARCDECTSVDWRSRMICAGARFYEGRQTAQHGAVCRQNPTICSECDHCAGCTSFERVCAPGLPAFGVPAVARVTVQHVGPFCAGPACSAGASVTVGFFDCANVIVGNCYAGESVGGAYLCGVPPCDPDFLLAQAWQAVFANCTGQTFPVEGTHPDGTEIQRCPCP